MESGRLFVIDRSCRAGRIVTARNSAIQYLPICGWSQPETGSITGTVTTSDGAAIGNAQVSGEGLHGPIHVRTAADGTYTITGVAPPRMYSIVDASASAAPNKFGIAHAKTLRQAVRIL